MRKLIIYLYYKFKNLPRIMNIKEKDHQSDVRIIRHQPFDWIKHHSNCEESKEE